MNRKLVYRILIMFFMIGTLSFSKMLSDEGMLLNKGVSDVSEEILGCSVPKEIKLSNVLPNSADFSWEDEENTEWEYYVQDAWETTPVGSGVLSSSKSVTVTRTSGLGGINLQPSTEYDFYVRASCGGGEVSSWVGPIRFKTPCNASTLPFWEGFNLDSNTIDCWKIVDNNEDSTSPTSSNIWKASTTSYEGTHSMYFAGNQSDVTMRPHDDWLISPVFNLDASKVYRLKYYYRFNSNSLVSYEYEYEVLLSDSGTDVGNFTTVIVPNKRYNPGTTWKEQTVFISGVNGNVSLAWHVTSSTQYTHVYIDEVSLEEVECPEPINLGSKDEDQSKSTIFWEDEFGSGWEYVVQKSGGGEPTLSGTITTNREVIVTKDGEGKDLEENTEYEFYVRTDCGSGKYSEWSGPYIFRTGCGTFTTPFWEGFNVGHDSKYCWTIIDSNRDSTSEIADVWHFNTTSYEGTHSARFNGTSSAEIPHDDWLISPKIEFEKGATYRVKYHYRTTSTTGYEYEFEVLLSDSGVGENNFTTTIVPKKKYDPDTVWKEQTTFIKGVEGYINLAWHVTSNTQYTTIYIDNIFVEEVENCPEPYELGIKDIETDKATIYWSDEMGGTKYEYFIQEAGGAEPLGNGVATTQKEVVATKDGKGEVLNHNTDYEFYVRTDCGDGTFSIWSGPVKFTTPCGVFETTFLENFNLNSPTMRCWTEENLMVSKEIINTYKNVFFSYDNYEGDDSSLLTNFIDNYLFGQSRTESNLISPKLKLEGGTYMLKYNYISPTAVKAFGIPLNTMMELKLSGIDDTGKAIEEDIVASKMYSADSWEEEVLFISGVSGEVNLEWHVTSGGTYYAMGIDNLSLKEVKTCPEPYFVEVTNVNSSSVTVQWEQFGDSTEWEVIVVNYGEDETAIPINIVNVSGTPEVVLSGLDSGKAYTVYVRAKCKDETSVSEWSSSVNAATEVSTNDSCAGSLNIPVNMKLECEKTLSISTSGATLSSAPLPMCFSDDVEADIWFEFTATSTAHLLSLKNIKELEEGSLPNFEIAVYGVDCSGVSTGAPLFCDAIYPYSSTERILTELVSGQKYLVRIAFPKGNYLFSLCVTQSEWGYMEVSASGEKYSVDELIKDVLIQSNCDLVSNVNYQVGDGSPATSQVNTLGYFSKGKTEFPFDEGIVLSTSEVSYVPGPYTPGGSFKGDNPHRWIGDKDINDAIKDAGGGPREDKRVTQVEFDFIPIKDSLEFEYLFVSNSYIDGCTYTCENGALFAAWLIDETTGEGINLAKIKGTNIPISLYTIWDSSKITGTSCSSYPELFWKNYSSGISHPLDAPFNFAGATKAMSSETVSVVPGRKYHIKLAVMDFCPTASHSSAVFFNAGSFDLGTLDLGEDLLVETNRALCESESVLLQSGVVISDELNMKIEWYKGDVLIEGANGSDLEVSEDGVYTVRIDFVDINCQREDSIKVEIYPPLSEVIRKPEAIVVCRNSLSDIFVDLSQVELGMFSQSGKDSYTSAYFGTAEEAEMNESPLQNVTDYNLGKEPKAQTMYIRVENTETGCHEVFELHVQPQKGGVPKKPEDVVVCAKYVFPEIDENNYYYTEFGGQGQEYKAGEVLDIPGEHTIYLLQVNSDEGCYEEISYKVNVTAPVIADVFEDVEIQCELYELQPLSEHNRYFTETNGEGMELYPGMEIPLAQTIYVYAESEDGLCTDESSFTITYNDCPIPRGISPNGDGLNDTFDLNRHGVESIKIYNRWGTEVYSHGLGYTDQWHGQNKGGKQLPDGTYYYVIVAHGKTRTGWVQINR